MNSLIDVNNLTFNNKKITVILDDNNTPWFYANEITDILGYSKGRKAITDNVKEKYIKNYSQLSRNHRFLPNSIQNITKFINEFGLYELIMKSKLPIAEKFQDWVFEDVLPSIRKHGEYILNKQLQEVTENFNKQLELKNNELELKNNELQLKDEKINMINNYINTTNITNIKKEWIYISTTKQYASNNIFKIGSTTNIQQRILGYQTGRHENDRYYYCYYRKVYNSKDIDLHIKKLLNIITVKKNTELYCLKFRYLEEIVDYLIDNYDKSVEHVNEFILNKLKDAILEPPDIPDELPIPENDDVIDFNELCTLVYKIIEYYIKNNRNNITRSQLIEYIDEYLINRNYDKKTLWRQIKQILNWKNSKTPIVYKNYEFAITY